DVFLDVWKRLADPPVLQSAHELAEKAHVRAEVEVSMQEVPLNQISVGAGRRPKIKVVVELKSRSQLGAEGHVPTVPVPDGDVLDGIPEVGAAIGVLEVAVILVVTEQLVRWRARARDRLTPRPQSRSRSYRARRRLGDCGRRGCRRGGGVGRFRGRRLCGQG